MNGKKFAGKQCDAYEPFYMFASHTQWTADAFASMLKLTIISRSEQSRSFSFFKDFWRALIGGDMLSSMPQTVMC